MGLPVRAHGAWGELGPLLCGWGPGRRGVVGSGGAVCRPVPRGLGEGADLRYPGGEWTNDRWNGSALVSADGGEEVRCPVLGRIRI